MTFGLPAPSAAALEQVLPVGILPASCPGVGSSMSQHAEDKLRFPPLSIAPSPCQSSQDLRGMPRASPGTA